MTSKSLRPPFSEERSIFRVQDVQHPASVSLRHELLKPEDDIQKYLEVELRVPKLNKVHSYLWLAGLPKPARALHRQKLMNRTICLTENPDEHLVWHESQIFVKPVPEYLLSYHFWDKELCRDPQLYECAAGILLSYSWLIGHKSDFRIAKETGILSEEVGQTTWTAFMTEFFNHINLNTLHQVNRRYHYGELRLSRLNSLYRFLPSVFSMRHFVYGFMSQSTWYKAFFETNFTWLLGVLVYITAVLSSMQVGLGVPKLQESKLFVGVSHVVSVCSIITFAAILGSIFLVWIGLFCFHLFSTLQYVKYVNRERAQHLQKDTG